MKQEQIIELVNKHGATSHGLPYSFSITIDNLTAIITEVEQATLEKAAQLCLKLSDEMIQDDHREGCIDCSYAVRNLAKGT